MADKTYKPVPRGTKKVMLTDEEAELLKPLQDALAQQFGSSKTNRADAVGYLIRHFAQIAAESVGALDPAAAYKANLRVVPEKTLISTQDETTEPLETTETLDDHSGSFDGLDILNGLLAA